MSGGCYDLVVLDLMMPGVDGYAAVDFLKNRQPGPPQARHHHQVAPEPFDLEQLREAIRNMCAGVRRQGRDGAGSRFCSAGGWVAAVSSQPGSGRSLLVVEDDVAIRRLVKMVLERNGYTVDVASDGLEAVLKLGIAEYDVIILDLMMPNLDGFAFMTTLAENDPSRLERIIVTSAASPAIIRQRMKGKPFDLLSKPFDIDHLVNRVGACIAARGADVAGSR